MKRSIWTVSLLGILCVLVALPALAADPKASKSVVGESDNASVVAVKVSAGSHAVYGVKIEVTRGSISDLVAPKGWVGIATDDGALFLTGSKPIDAGSSASFRLITSGKAEFSVSFRDDIGAIGGRQSI